MKHKQTKLMDYNKSWREYDLAQTNETIEFLKMAHSLTRRQTSLNHARGRPQASIDDILLSLLIHTYSGRSSRRSNGELKLAQELGLIGCAPHFTVLMRYMNQESITNILHELITRTSEPLAHLETDFAADGTGFTTNRYSEWKSYKYGRKYGKEKNWIKAHIMVGTKTMTAVSAIITKGTANDCPQLPLLIDKMSGEFIPKRISADKAYSARYNIDKIRSVGAESFIPFKSNTSKKSLSKGHFGWRTALKVFNEQPEYFYKHYHKRSLSETAFSMIKRKFQPTIRTKRFKSQVNEVLLKIVCHNICVLIRYMNS